MKLICPKCQAAGNIGDEFRGKKIRCPSCSEVFVAGSEEAPVSAATTPGPDSPAAAAAPVNTPTETAPPPAQPQKRCSQCRQFFNDDELLNFDGTLVCGACKAHYLQKKQEGAVEAGSGSLEGGMAGNYDFQTMELVKEAWALTKGAKGSIWGGMLISYLIVIVLMLPFELLIADPTDASNVGGYLALSFISQLVVQAISYPLFAGLIMIGIRRAAEQPYSFKLVFAYFNKIVPLAITGILMTIIVTIGFMMLLVPGIYLAVAYGLALPLVVEKDLGPWQALEASRKALSKKWFKVFGLYLVSGLICMVSAIPLGIGLIWTMPMFMILIGVLYRTIFGVEALD